MITILPELFLNKKNSNFSKIFIYPGKLILFEIVEKNWRERYKKDIKKESAKFFHAALWKD